MYPQYPAAQQPGTNTLPSSSVPGQLPPSSYGQTAGVNNYPYAQQNQPMGQPPGMGGSAMQGQMGQYPQKGSQPMSGITAGVQQMRMQPQGNLVVNVD